MTLKQKRFCEEYVKTGNATQSAKNAGYSEKTSYAIGEQNLKKLEVQEYIKKLNDGIEEKSIADLNECLKLLTYVMRNSGDEQAQLKAIDIRLKTLGAYLEKRELSGEINIEVNIDED